MVVQEDGSQPRRPLIIGGCPRSGTTLLRTMLHCHPEVAIPRETHFVLEAWRRRRSFGDFGQEANRIRLAKWIFTREETQADRLALEADEAISRLAAAPPTLGSLLATCFVMFADKEGKPRWGDKRPMYAERLATMLELFPSAYFIHVVRDPRACVASLRKLGWYDGHIAPMTELWERSLHGVEACRRKLAADQLLEVRYEDLVSDPERIARQVASFTGIAADESAVESMLRYHEYDETRDEQYHSNLRRPIDPSLISSWKDAFTEEEIAFVEKATRPLMLHWGYEAVVDGVSVPPDLMREFEKQRRRQMLVRWRRVLHNEWQKRVTERRPLAAEVPVVAGRPAG
jgi:Sulfotransferase family